MHDIVCLQEIWLAFATCIAIPYCQTLTINVHVYWCSMLVISSIYDKSQINVGRPSGGVDSMWRKHLNTR